MPRVGNRDADLIRLGERDERLKMAAYCDFTINGVAKLLEEHLTITDKIDGMSCFGRDKLEKIGKLIKEKRTNLQAKAVKYHIDIQGNSTSLSSASSNLNMLQSSDDDQEEASKPGPLPASQTKKSPSTLPTSSTTARPNAYPNVAYANS